jgi:hypothetical protein
MSETIQRFYKHYNNGRTYEIVCFAKNEGDGANVVVYKYVGSSAIYVRPHVEFFAQVTNEFSIKVNRFEPVNGGSA